MAQPSAPPSYDVAVGEKPAHELSHVPYPPAGYQTAPSGYSSVPQSYPPNPKPTNYSQSGIANAPVNPDTVQPLGNAPPNTNNEASGFTTAGGFDDKSIRRVFIRKVFAVLFVQLLITFGFICVFLFVLPVRIFVQENPGVYYASYGVFIVTYLVLVCSGTVARKHPVNLIMLLVLTLALSFMVGTITSFYSIEAVLIGFGVTTGVCLTVIIFSIQTKFDFTKCGGLLFVLVMVLFLFGFVTIFTYSQPWYIQVVYGSLGALVFTLFLAFDVQLVMGGRKYELDPEEYIFGALNLYIDVVYIFIFLLAIFGGSN